MRSTSRLAQLPVYLVLGLGAALSLFPFYWMFVAATLPSHEVLRFPPRLLPGGHALENLAGLERDAYLAQVLANSLVIALSSMAVGLLVCSMAGYAFAKFRFRGRDAVFALLLVTLMVPPQVTMIPLFRLVMRLDWINTYQAVVVPTLGSVFGIFMMRQAMAAVPTSLLESARLDGASEWRIFAGIVLPVMRPALAALGIYLFMYQWNNFMWPLIVLNEPTRRTLPVMLANLVGVSYTDYGQVMMGAAVSTLPVMVAFLALQRHFIAGLLGGATKG